MKNVMVVDDDEICVFLSKKIFNNIDMITSVHYARHGGEALAAIQSALEDPERLPHYVLLDLAMPVMDGFTFLKEFGALTFAQKSSIKIVILTSSNSHLDIARAKQLGADHYMVKPLDENTLRAYLAHDLPGWA